LPPLLACCCLLSIALSALDLRSVFPVARDSVGSDILLPEPEALYPNVISLRNQEEK
jgi:hypothetical protein